MATQRKLLLETLSRSPEVYFEEQASSWELHIRSHQNWTIQITVPFKVFEWYVSVSTPDTGTKLWSDWLDYAGYGKHREPILLEHALCTDIDWFVHRALEAQDLRITEDRILFGFRKKHAEWLIDEYWSAVSLSTFQW